MPKVTFVSPTGERTTLEPPAGLSLLEIARKYHIDIEGACEGSLACSTCHVVVDPEWFDALDEMTFDGADGMPGMRELLTAQFGESGSPSSTISDVRRFDGPYFLSASWLTR